MARIPEADIERLKSEVSVQRLVEAAGLELKRVGKDLAARCPFHEDDTASLIVTPAKNLWHCFGCQIEVLQGLEWVARVADTLSRSFRAEVTRWTAPSFIDSCWA